MRLLVIRHAKALSREKWHKDDTERPLTKDGIEQASLAFSLMRGRIDIDEVWTSPWLRARQTAKLICESWRKPLREVDWLAGGASGPAQWEDLLPTTGDIALVGHEPDLGEMLGFLLGGRPMPLKKGGMALLEGSDNRTLALQLLVSPRLLSDVAENA